MNKSRALISLIEQCLFERYKKILLIEDDEDLQDLVSDRIEDYGPSVKVVASFEGAVKEIKTKKYDLV